MQFEVSTNCCRVCLTTNKKLRSLYKAVDEGDEPPNEMLQKITGIEVEELEEHTMLPKNICKNCEMSLSMAFEFREKALQSQDVIVSYMRELKIPFHIEKKTQITAPKANKDDLAEDKNHNNPPLEEISPEFEEEILNTTSNSTSAVDNTTEMPDEDEIIITAVKDECKLSDDGAEMEVFLEEDVIYEDDELCSISEMEQQSDEDAQNESINAEHIIEEDEDDEELQKEIAKCMEAKNGRKRNVSSRIEIDLACSIQSEDKQMPRRSRKRIPNNFGYICDICGNVYAKRGRMMEHRQRHKKELKYSCELCDKKFHMRELLRKHMYSHSGGKPLKCEYCSRTFYYESVRKAHEAVHKGLKPYVCDVCGKAFGYGHSLKKHKLIHAEVKLYRCNYCNKDFRLQHHMKQHELTKAHLKAVHMAGGQVDNMTLDHDQEPTDDVILEEEENSNPE